MWGMAPSLLQTLRLELGWYLMNSSLALVTSARPRGLMPPVSPASGPGTTDCRRGWCRRKPSLDREKMTANKNLFARSWFYRKAPKFLFLKNQRKTFYVLQKEEFCDIFQRSAWFYLYSFRENIIFVNQKCFNLSNWTDCWSPWHDVVIVSSEMDEVMTSGWVPREATCAASPRHLIIVAEVMRLECRTPPCHHCHWPLNITSITTSQKCLVHASQLFLTT